MPPSPPILVCLLALALAGAPSSAQAPVSWSQDLGEALTEATRRDVPVLLLFTVGASCPRCHAFESEVFGAESYGATLGAEMVHVKVDCLRDRTRACRVLQATAQLRLWPTVYLLTADGWPFHALHGFAAGETLEGFVREVREALPRRSEVARHLGRGRRGYRELLKLYRARDVPFGTTLAAAALQEAGGASRSDRAGWARHLIGPAICRGEPWERYLTVVRKHDPKNRKSLLTNTLQEAGRWLLQTRNYESAVRVYEEVLTDPHLRVRERVDTCMGLGFACRKLRRPCTARRCYADAADLILMKKRFDLVNTRAAALQRLEQVKPCGQSPCTCE